MSNLITELKCDCQTWARDGQPPITSHNKHCTNYNLEKESVDLVTELINGILESSADCDGIHPDLWEPYKKALLFVGDYEKLREAIKNEANDY